MYRYGRNLTTLPVSQVLSSQIGNTSDVSYTSTTDSSVQLTFHYNLSQHSKVSQLLSYQLITCLYAFLLMLLD